MMLRWVVVSLLVANLLFWAWSGGRLDALVGMPAQGDREPERIAQQIEPQAIRLLSDAEVAPAGRAASRPASAVPASAAASRPAAASAPVVRASAPLPVAASAASRSPATAASAAGVSLPASASASAAASAPAALRAASAAAARAASAAASTAAVARPAAAPASAPAAPRAPSALPPEPAASAGASAGVACLEAGPFGPGELASVRTTLAGTVPAGRWSERRQETPGLWMIYMGPYADPEMLQKKKDEVAGIRVAFNPVDDLPGFESGLSLGRFDSRPAADAALARSVSQGIRTARVVMVRAPVVVHHLRVGAVEPPVAARLASLRLGTAARSFRSC